VALAAGFLLFRRAAGRRLPAAVGATRARVLAAAGAQPGRDADRALRDSLVGLYEIATAARAELSPAPGTADELRRSRRVADLGWALLGARAQEDPGLAAQVAAAIRTELG
jgi:hypothetical protein